MNIRISGFGGQGVILSGVILGWAAILDGKNAIQTQSYGSAARGGACKSDVIIMDSYIYELEPVDVDILVAFSQPAYDKFNKKLKKDGLLFVDSDLVKNTGHPAKTYSIPASDIAFKEIGMQIIGNIVMMGYAAKKIGGISPEAIEKSIGRYAPKKYLEQNIKAFRRGMEIN